MILFKRFLHLLLAIALDWKGHMVSPDFTDVKRETPYLAWFLIHVYKDWVGPFNPLLRNSDKSLKELAPRPRPLLNLLSSTH